MAKSAGINSSFPVFFLDTTSHKWSPILGGVGSIVLNGFTAGGGSARITEDSNVRITEDGNTRIIE